MNEKIEVYLSWNLCIKQKIPFIQKNRAIEKLFEIQGAIIDQI